MLYFEAGNAFQIASYNGEPIWPISNSDALAALKNFNDAYGGTMEQVQVFDDTPARTLGGVVVGIGPLTHQAAALYAHLTQRDVVLLFSVTEFSTDIRCDVVVLEPSSLSVELFDKLYWETIGEHSPGIIVFDGSDASVAALLVRAANRKIAVRGQIRRTEIHPTLPLHPSYEKINLFGSNASSAALKVALSANSEILVVDGHSDGIDASLGNVTLCSAVSGIAFEKPLPACVEAGFCHRLSQDIESVPLSGTIVSPHEISANILVMCVCWGIRPRPSLVSPQNGFMRHLIESPKIGVIVTTWDVVTTFPTEINTLTEKIEQGWTVGRAVSAENSSETSKWSHRRLCIFGDPNVRLQLSNDPTLIPRLERLGSVEQSVESTTSPTAFLEQLLTSFTNTTDRERSELANEALRIARSAGFRDASANIRAQNEILGLMLNVGHYICNKWLLHATPVSQPTRSACWICGLRTIPLSATLSTMGGRSRTVLSCPQCGIVSDCPSEPNLTPSVKFCRDHMNLKLSYPVDRVAVLYAPLARSRYSGKVLESGASEFSLSFEELPPPKYTKFVVVFVVKAWDLYIYRRPIFPGEIIASQE